MKSLGCTSCLGKAPTASLDLYLFAKALLYARVLEKQFAIEVLRQHRTWKEVSCRTQLSRQMLSLSA